MQRPHPERLHGQPEVDRQPRRGALRVAAEVEPARLVGHHRRLRLGLGIGFGLGGCDYSDALEGGIEMALARVAAQHDEGDDPPGDDEQRELQRQAGFFYAQAGWAARAGLQCANRAGHGRWVALVALVACSGAAAAQGPVTTDEPGSFPAAFAARSYAPGETASLTLWAHAPRVTVRSIRVGPEKKRAPRDDVLLGVPAGPGADRRLAQGRLHSASRRARAGSTSPGSRPPTGALGVRRLRPAAAPPRLEPRRDHRADEHLAGLQLPRRRRERHRRHLVREPLLQRRRSRPGRS